MDNSDFPKNIYDLALGLPNYLRDIKSYEFKQLIGKGGFGEVFLGIDKVTKKKVAIKKPIDGKMQSNFSSLYIREIYIMAKMNSISPYFLPLAGYTVEAPYCIITEYMQKGSLHKYYQNHDSSTPKFNGTQSQIIAIQILLGINSMHSRGFIHRDIKLGNILLDQDNTPKIADLGLSRMKTSDNLMTRKIGTITTMAPEVFNGQPYTYSADVYSFGIILYTMNERRPPPKNMTKDDLKNGSLFRSPSLRYTNATPQSMRDLIDLCIRYNPEERPTIQTIVGKLLNGEAKFNGAKTKKILQFFNKQAINNYSPSNLPEKIPNYQEFIHNLESRYKSFLQARKKRMEEQKAKEAQAEVEKKKTDDTNVKKKIDQIIDESFIENLNKKASEITPNNFDTFFDNCVRKYLENEQYSKCYEFIVSLCSLIMETDTKYIQLFSKRNYERLIPLLTPTLISFGIEYMCNLFNYCPNEVSTSAIKLMVVLIEERPVEMATVFSYYAKQFGIVTNPFPVTDTFLINYKFFFSEPSSAQLYLSIIYNLTTNFPVFREKRLQDVKTILAESFNNSESLKFGLQTAILIYTPEINNIIPFDLMVKTLSEKVEGEEGSKLTELFISLLLRLDKIPLSNQLFESLIEKAKTDKKCIKILLKFSECSKDHFSLFVNNLNWLLLDLPTIDDTFLLFLSIFRDRNVRNQIGLSDQFIDFLNRIISTSQPYYLSVIPSLMRRFNATKEFFEKLEKSNFFRTYFEKARELNDPEVNMKAAILLDQTSRLFFCNDLLLFIPRLREMASINGQAEVAIGAATSLSYFQPFKEALVRCGFVQAFQYLRNSPVYGEKAAMFLKNIGCK